MKEKSSIHESHKAEFVANAIYVTSSFCRNFQMLIEVLHSACSQCLAFSFNNQLLQFTGNKHGKISLLLFVFFVIPINHTQTLGVRYYKKIFFFPNQCGRLQEPVRLGFPNVISTSNVHKSFCKPNFLSSDRFSSDFLFKTLPITYFSYWLFTCFIPREKKKKTM